jgi:hypothetical protein
MTTHNSFKINDTVENIKTNKIGKINNILNDETNNTILYLVYYNNKFFEYLFGYEMNLVRSRNSQEPI